MIRRWGAVCLWVGGALAATACGGEGPAAGPDAARPAVDAQLVLTDAGLEDAAPREAMDAAATDAARPDAAPSPPSAAASAASPFGPLINDSAKLGFRQVQKTGSNTVIGDGVGAAGLGLSGTGKGGGGEGFGRIHGMGSISTMGRGAGGLGTSAGGGIQWRLPPRAERWTPRVDQGFVTVAAQPLSTLSIDADSASYSLTRDSLSRGTRPEPASVYIEDFVNRFDYGDAPPTDGQPLRIVTDVGAAPWAPEHRLVRIGVKAAEVSASERAAANLVFLLDVSGSMNGPDRLGLVKQGLAEMVTHLEARDRVAIVTYAGAAGLALPSTPATDRAAILAALDQLTSGGSTAGGEGIELAYQVAARHFVKGGNNRVVLATDGDFNVGLQDQAGLKRLIEAKRKTGVLLTVLGVGRGNLRAQQMEAIAQHGDGGFHFLDGLTEARRVLVDELTRTLVTVACDVKVQVEFNPAQVKAYRLLGYENRTLAAEDFNDDKKDAGELQAGHTVSVLYELVPAGSDEAVPGVDPLTYQRREAVGGADLLTVKVRAKRPTAQASTRWSVAVRDSQGPPSEALRFASAVVELALLLRDDPHRGAAAFPALIERAKGALGADPFGARAALVALATQAQAARPWRAGAVGLGQRRAGKRDGLTVTPAGFEGPCRRQVMERVVRARQRGLQYCYEKALHRDPSLKGKVALTWTVGPDGRTTAATAKPDKAASLGQVPGCMERQVRRWRAPEQGGACTVKLTLALRSAGR